MGVNSPIRRCYKELASAVVTKIQITQIQEQLRRYNELFGGELVRLRIS